MKILVTGGAGFIGSALVRHIINQTQHSVIVLDKLTYAGNLTSLEPVSSSARYQFVQGDICDASLVKSLLSEYKPDAVMHLAAESHVDRSIDAAADFIQTNIVGTYMLLEKSLEYWRESSGKIQENFRFHHISTDEVFGSLGSDGRFTEQTSYDPSSPYSASKASSDHLARVWQRTFGLPVILTNCSNNYGPYQYPEKLIPLTILNALEGKELPVYGKGENVRDWLFVEDHVRALLSVIQKGKPGETYNIGGNSERKNIEVVRSVCRILDELAPRSDKHEKLIRFVADRPGHDFRYAISAEKIQRDLGWKPTVTFEQGLRLTVEWYVDNRHWCDEVQRGTYDRSRLGLNDPLEKGDEK